ncbi:MAG: hypothetical protein JWM35_2716, partial [Verrucomicrobia bacterium]|nr:hypothetical protein [Verrucomicrobiota bacterium]
MGDRFPSKRQTLMIYPAPRVLRPTCMLNVVGGTRLPCAWRIRVRSLLLAGAAGLAAFAALPREGRAEDEAVDAALKAEPSDPVATWQAGNSGREFRNAHAAFIKKIEADAH